MEHQQQRGPHERTHHQQRPDWQRPDYERPEHDEPRDASYGQDRHWGRERGFDSERSGGAYRGSSTRRSDEGFQYPRGNAGDGSWGRPSPAEGSWQRGYDSRSSDSGNHPRAGHPSAYQGGGSVTADRWMRRGPHTGRGPKGYRRSDEQIVDEVNRRLQQDGDVDATEISVTCSAGVVTLEGKVSDRGAKRAAEECAEDVHGVEDVLNHLRVDKGFFAQLFGSSDDDTTKRSSSSSNEIKHR